MCRESDNIERAGLVAAVEQAADGLVITDTNGKIQYVNPAFTAMTGYTAQEAVGQYPRILKSGRHSSAFYEELWSTIRSGRVWHGQVINRRKDGTFYDEEMRITPVRGSNGEIVSYIAIKHDVTERRVAEEARGFLAAIVETSEDAIATYTPAGIILTWNRGAEAIFGYAAADAIGKQVSMLVAPEQLPRLAYFTEQVLQGNVISQYEGVCLRKDGRRVHVSATGSAIKNSGGEVAAVAAILRDISERQEAEHTRALLASIVESSDEAIHRIAMDGTIVSWNRGAEALLGYAAQEIIGKNVAILIPPGSEDELCPLLGTIGSGCGRSPLETVLKAKDGRRIHVSLSVSPIRNSAGEVMGAAVIAHDIGTRLRAERKLQESEQRFHEVFDHAPFGICATGLDGRFLQVNEALCQMLGYGAEELRKAAWVELMHPGDRELSLRKMEQLLKEPDGCLDGEKRYRHRGGKVVWARVRVSMVRDRGGSPLYFVTHAEDITERKRAEEALRESEDRFRIMADGCPAAMWVTNAEGGIQFINRAYEELGGITYEQAEGDKWQLAIHPEDAPAYVAAFQRAVRQHTPFRAEARVKIANGEWRWVFSYAEPRMSPDGEFVGHVGLSPDITESKQAQQALQSSEEKFRQIAETIREVFWIMPPAANEMLYISPAYEQVWGRSCASIYQNPMSWMEAIHPDDREAALLLVKRQLRGESVELECRIRTPDGLEKWIRSRTFPIRDQAGQLTRIVAIAEEVTEWKRYEGELIEARKHADAATRAKSHFLSSMSHEIRTPLCGVIGMTGLLLDTPLTAEQQGYAEIVRSSAEGLLGILNDILDFSKIEAGKLDLEVVPFDLRSVLKDVAELLEAKAHEKQLELRLRYDADAPREFLGDPGRIRQVALNLVGNAIKFTDHGHVLVEVSGRAITGGWANIRIAVRDTGIGIPSDRQGMLFQKFQQLDSSTTRKYGGTGLGLAISKQFIEMMGGTLSLTSQVGKGSTFSAEIPLRTYPLPWEVSREGEWRQTRALHSFAGRRVLLVEDNIVNQKVGTALLGKLGCRVDVAANGREALEMTSQLRYDLIFMDCQMPEMDGYVATGEIRKREGVARHTPIIALTAGAMAEDRERCVQVGMDDYVSKPMRPAQLREMLDTHLHRVRPLEQVEIVSTAPPQIACEVAEVY